MSSSEDLGRRYIVACETLGLKVWRPLMVDNDGAAYLGPEMVAPCDLAPEEPTGGHWWAEPGVYSTGRPCAWRVAHCWESHTQHKWPNFDHPASLGGLMSAVREAWGDQRICCKYDAMDDDWFVAAPPGAIKPRGASAYVGLTEAEAWVAALEAKARAMQDVESLDRKEP